MATITLTRTIIVRQGVPLDVPDDMDPDDFGRESVTTAKRGVYDEETWAEIKGEVNPSSYDYDVIDAWDVEARRAAFHHRDASRSWVGRQDRSAALAEMATACDAASRLRGYHEPPPREPTCTSPCARNTSAI